MPVVDDDAALDVEAGGRAPAPRSGRMPTAITTRSAGDACARPSSRRASTRPSPSIAARLAPRSTTSMPRASSARRQQARGRARRAGAPSGRSIRCTSVTAHAARAPGRRPPRARAARRRSRPPARPAAAALAWPATSARSRNVMTPGRSAPGSGRRIGSEPVASTQPVEGAALAVAQRDRRAARIDRRDAASPVTQRDAALARTSRRGCSCDVGRCDLARQQRRQQHAVVGRLAAPRRPP